MSTLSSQVCVNLSFMCNLIYYIGWLGNYIIFFLNDKKEGGANTLNVEWKGFNRKYKKLKSQIKHLGGNKYQNFFLISVKQTG